MLPEDPAAVDTVEGKNLEGHTRLEAAVALLDLRHRMQVHHNLGVVLNFCKDFLEDYMVA